MRKNRWGSIQELDRRVRVATPAFYAQPKRLQHLQAWRAMHKVAGGHGPVRMSGTRQQVRPSSNMTIQQKVQFVLNKNLKSK